MTKNLASPKAHDRIHLVIFGKVAYLYYIYIYICVYIRNIYVYIYIYI